MEKKNWKKKTGKKVFPVFPTFPAHLEKKFFQFFQQHGKIKKFRQHGKKLVQ